MSITKYPKDDSFWRDLHLKIERGIKKGVTKTETLKEAGIPANAYYGHAHKLGLKISSLEKPKAKSNGHMVEFVNPDSTSSVELQSGNIKITLKNPTDSTLRAVLTILEERQ